MLIKVEEYEGCFGLDLTPETQEDIIVLVRLGINKTKELRGVFVDAYNDKTLSASIVIGKKKNPITKVGE